MNRDERRSNAPGTSPPTEILTGAMRRANTMTERRTPSTELVAALAFLGASLLVHVASIAPVALLAQRRCADCEDCARRSECTRREECRVCEDLRAQGEEGEHGLLGAGGRSVDITVRSVSARSAPPPTPSPSSDAPPPAPRARIATEPRSQHARTITTPEGRETVAEPIDPRHPPHPGEANQVRRGTVDNGGLAPGSVGAQRSRLPRAARCGDPVAGTWRAHTYVERGGAGAGDWVIFTLRIERSSEGALSGTIRARTWAGGPRDSRPLPCPDSDYDFAVRMPAQGRANGLEIDFGASRYQIERVYCPSRTPIEYNPDHFSGTIDPERQEFQSVNNDGGLDINQPYVFRRIACVPGDELPPQGAAPATGARRAPESD